MANVDKISLLKELDIYSSLLKKYEALQREKINKAVITQPARINQQSRVQKTFQDYTLVNKRCHLSSFNDKFSFKNPSHFTNTHVKSRSGLFTQNQVSRVTNSVVMRKKLNKVPLANCNSSFNSKRDSPKISSTSSNESNKLTSNTEDFIKEVETLTKLLKMKTSNSPHKISNSKLSIKNFKEVNKNAVKHTNAVMKTNPYSKTKYSIGSQQKNPFISNNLSRVNHFMSANIKSNPPQQKNLRLNKSVYRKNNVNHSKSLIVNSDMSSKCSKNIIASKSGFEKTDSSSTPGKIMFSDNKNLSPESPATSKTNEVHKKTSSSSQKRIVELHTPKLVLSSKKNVKKAHLIGKIKSPIFLKLKSINKVKVPRVVHLNQSSAKYTKINKHLTPPNKICYSKLNYPTQHKSSLKKIKKKVNSKYKVINKTLPSSSSKKINTSSSTGKNITALSMDGDDFLKALDDPAIDKLEKKLLALSSELTKPLPDINSESAKKRIHVKKYKSRISKYKIINSNTPHMTTSLRKERAVLVRRLFKSKNAIINKNASPTSYSAKLIKSKYLSLNKRKSSNCQKYAYPAQFQQRTFKGSYSSSTLYPKWKEFKRNESSRSIRRTSYGYQSYTLTNKNKHKYLKTKINNRTAKRNFQRATTTKLFLKTQENFNKASPASTGFASRVLHRSINRILTASSKKKLSKINSYCMFYNRFGRCNRGVKCTYIHDPSKIAVCTRFLRGTCKIDGCPFSHEVDPGKMAICSFFIFGQCAKENCPYRHEKLSQDAVLCKDFVQGYCHNGKECKKAHILICPKYMQGNCDKGSSCTFPHPPHKPKKNIQEEARDDESKPTDVLLEKVLRYFQQTDDSQNKLNENNAANLFVPKQRKQLEQQPSFIPLSD